MSQFDGRVGEGDLRGAQLMLEYAHLTLKGTEID